MKRIGDLARGVTGGVRPRDVPRGAPEVGPQALRDAARALDDARRAGPDALERGRVRGVDVGTSRRGLAGEPAHVYLPENRFEWWWARPPATGAVMIEPGTENPEARAAAAFRAEFASG